MKKTNQFKVVSLTAIAALSVGTGINSAIAVELSNGQTAFEASPRLVKAATTSNGINTQHSTYRFTISVPEDAGESLKALRIEQLENVETIEFRDQTSRAFLGTKTRSKAEVSLAPIGGPSESGTLNFVFAEPIQPGNTVTVSVSPRRNPSRENIYQFGITAFPEGVNSRGQFLGHGRLSFSSFR